MSSSGEREVFRAIAVKDFDATAMQEPNGTANVSITNVAPAGVGTATISLWLKFLINGIWHYIPAWT